MTCADPPLEPSDPARDLRVSGGSSELLERLRARIPARSRYRVLGEVGRGGMGAVMRIWDEDLRRTSAMKVVLGDGDAASEETRSVASDKLGRFLEEAQVTGQLDHPGIVPVHELGLAPDGRVYFTMRLVEGEDLGRVFDHVRTGAHGWNQTRALGVLLKVCEAMAFAHAKGVIHRDLKPANVMVGRFGEVYVMDWGLARVLGQSDRHDLRIDDRGASRPAAVESDRAAHRGGSSALAGDDLVASERPASPPGALVTLDGTVLGTPTYMPPEQARGEIESLGPTADVYALGAMLYELIAGETPFVSPGVRLSPLAVLRQVIEGPPPALSESAPRAPPELIAICEKAMARDARERYRDMAELGDDLRAYLERRVVRAHQTGAWAETKKWVQRNKPLAGSLFAVVLAIAAGSVAFAIQAERAKAAAARAEANARAESAARAEAQLARANAEEHARIAAENARRAEDNARIAQDNAQRAEESARIARTVTLFVQNALVRSDPNVGGRQDYLVTDAIEQAMEALAADDLADDPATEWTLQLTIARILDGNGRSAEALGLAEAALETLRRMHAGDHADLAAGLERVGAYSMSLGRVAEALPMLEQAIAMQRRLDASDRLDLALSLNSRAYALKALGRGAEALPVYEEALAMMQRLAPGGDGNVARCLVNIAACLDTLGRSEEALPKHETALAMRRRLFPGDHPDVAGGLSNLALCLEALGRKAEALPRYEESLAMQRRLFEGDHPAVAVLENNLGMCLLGLGRNHEALPRLEAGRAMYERIFPRNHPLNAASLNNVGLCLQSLGRHDDALLSLLAALEISEAAHAGDHPEVARLLGNVAGCLHALGQSAEALPYAERADAMAARVLAAGHPWRKSVANVLEKIREAVAK